MQDKFSFPSSFDFKFIRLSEINLNLAFRQTNRAREARKKENATTLKTFSFKTLFMEQNKIKSRITMNYGSKSSFNF